MQLALALLLREHLPGLAGPPETYDPAFSDVDRALLAALGVHVIEVNEGGARAVSEPTLFYLPHCEVRRMGRMGRVGRVARHERGGGRA